MENPPKAPDIAQVLKHNRTLRYRHIAARLTLAVILFAVPIVARLAGWDAALPMYGIPAGLFVLTFLVLRLGYGARFKVCEKVLSRLGPHGACKMVNTTPCNGTTKSITLADYQRALTDSSEQTYQPSVLEKAQSGMTKTWDCVSSLFTNC